MKATVLYGIDDNGNPVPVLVDSEGRLVITV